MYVLVFLVVSFLLVSHQYSTCIPLFSIRATRFASLILLDLMILIILGALVEDTCDNGDFI
jgi:hypothetical protein